MKHFINGIEITPRNRTEIGVVSDFTGNPDVLSLNVETIILPNEGMEIVQQHIQSVGLFEGIPYRIEMEGGISLDYYIDLLDQSYFRQHECEVKIKKRYAKDQFKERADGTSFELMLAKGVQFNTFDVPYFVIKDNQLEVGITLAISVYIMTKETIEAARDLVQATTELIEASTPNVGIPPSINLGAVISLSLKMVARLIYFSLLLVALIELATQLFTLIFPPKRNLLGTKFKELCQKGCQFLGYTFESTIFDQQPNWTLLPVPLIKNRKSIWEFLPDQFFAPFNKGVPSSSDTTPTFGMFLEALETMFNARIYVNNSIVRLERRDYWQNVTSNQLSPALSLQSERDDQYSFNTSDAWKRYYIHYQLDYSDTHTLDALYDSHDTELSTEPTSIVNPDLINIKGLNDVSIPFALGARKTKLNWFEQYAKGLFETIDIVSGLFGGGTNYAQKIGDRKDCMKVSQDFFSVTKALYTVNGKQNDQYLNTVSANSIWNKWHQINEITQNDWLIKENVRIRLNSSDFVNLLNNNYAEIDGLLCEILRIEWIDEKSFAQISYKVPFNYATGRVFTQLING